MYQPCFFILMGLTAIRATAISRPPITTKVADSLLASNNITLTSGRPDARFHVSPSIGPELLPINPTLVNILHFMAELACKDHNESVAADTWSTPDASEVTIVTQEAIQTKYLLWGIFEGIEYMIKNKRFHEVFLTLRWESEKVGEIWLMPSELAVNLALNTSAQSLTQQSDNSRTRSNSTGVRKMLPDSQVVNEVNALAMDISVGISTLPGGGPLTRFDVFLVCYAAMIHLSLAKPETRMEDTVSKSPLSSVVIHMFRWGPGAKVYQAIQLMIYLPRAMLDSPQGFREITFNLRVDGRTVIQGTINKGPDSHTIM